MRQNTVDLGRTYVLLWHCIVLLREVAMESEQSETLPQKSRFLGTPEIELDLPPEYCHYRDDGCEFADSCLNCPLPRCIYDQPRGRQRWLKRLRDKEIVRLASSDRKGVKELALRFSVSQRTVQRVLERMRNE